jgi:Uma2 family endonuclease
MGPALLKRKRPATYADIEALPEHVVGEIVNGELVVSPRPAPAHALAASGVGGELHGPFHVGRGGPGGWWILDEPELHVGQGVLVPDVAGWRRERMPRLPETPWFDVVPDWVCEVLSPSTGLLDRAEKLPIYLVAGVSHAWLIDPQARTLEVFRAESGRWVLALASGGEQRVRAQPFDAIEIDLSVLWPPPTPG